MSTPRRMLVAVDGSRDAAEAARFAAQWLRSEKEARMTLAYVLQTPSYSPDSGMWNPEETLSQEREWAEKMLSALAKELKTPTLALQAVVLSGSPAETLAARAEAEHDDIVVCGSRGRGTVARVLLGSVSDRLCHISTKPVLVVR